MFNQLIESYNSGVCFLEQMISVLRVYEVGDNFFRQALYRKKVEENVQKYISGSHSFPTEQPTTVLMSSVRCSGLVIDS